MKKSDITVLLVDDEPDILEIIGYNLKQEGYQVITAINGLDALKKAVKHKPQLIIIDVMMPEMDGVEACEQMRKLPGLEHTLITFLTARGEDYSQLAGFQAGADDYITKPIRPKVLISKLTALLRRLEPAVSEIGILQIGDLTIDREQYKVKIGHESLVLPRKEFELLSLLASHAGKVFNREEILNIVWGSDVVVGDRTIDVHIRKLREKLGDEKFKTIKGVGYKFVN